MKKVIILALLSTFAYPQQKEDLKFFSRLSAEFIMTKCSAVNRLDITRETLPASADAADLTYCYGYISAMADMQSVLKSANPNGAFSFCIPDQAKVPQLAKVLVHYGDAHPERWHYGGLWLAVFAFYDAFPCPQ